MIFTPASIAGVWILSPERHSDHRGFFARTFCEREFAAQGLVHRFVQCNMSYNQRRGTLRGLHFQRPPAEEVKVVRCTRGAAYDVVVDLRPESLTYRQWEAVEITPGNGLGIYIPQGCAHGFQTLADDTELLYQMGEYYAPDLAAGVRWNDPALAIRWPIAETILSERDAAYPDL